jgi:hypothetical protein
MEEVINFDKWISEYTLPVITYVATYDPATGAVKSVGPSHAFENEKYLAPLYQNSLKRN